ncbi:MAG TPA: FG-GAP-like repeat-containing protein [Chthoniobacterales bacterium]
MESSLAQSVPPPGDDRIPYPGSLKEVAQGAAAPAAAATLVRAELTAAEEEAAVEFSVALKMRDLPGLQARISKGETITPDEMADKYYPTEADYQRVATWLTTQGFTVAPAGKYHLSVFASGSVAQVERAFATKFGRVSLAGVESLSALTAPSLPASTGTAVLGINGLQPHLHPHRHSSVVAAGPQKLTANSPPYTVAEISKAYNAVGLGVNGSGQKIGIIIDTFPADSDLTKFWQANGISQSLNNVEKVQVVPGTLPSPSGEETLDAEWSSGMAAGAMLRIYATVDLSFNHLDQAYQKLINDLPSQPSLHQLSLSYGLGETYTSDAQMQTDTQYFASLAGGGVSIFVSSGDGGSSPGSSGHDHSGPVQTESPANDPHVTAVGGTSLYLSGATGNVSSEGAWSGGGGGISQFFQRPVWQNGTGVPSGSKRLVPDMALVADPTTGGYLVLNNQPYETGGTSWSAPTWAGVCAMVNQARTNLGQSPLGLLGPKIYPLLGTTAFRDITTGSNGTSGTYNSGAGFDLCTGIGVPNVALLQKALTSTQASRVTKDFDHDGQADILWQNTQTGALMAWLMKGGVHTGTLTLPSVPSPWNVVGTGDFNNDGYADLLLQNTTTREYVIWFLKNGAFVNSVTLATLSPDFRIAAVGDFDGDGTADVVWENTTSGDHYIWFIKNGAHTGSDIYLGRVAVAWQVAGAADFDKSGQADLIWENTATGNRTIWILNTGVYVKAIALGPVALKWHIAGAADFTGDGQADIIWESPTTGEHVIWVMKNGVWSGTLPLPTMLPWQVREH